jgi:hypothetical protein
VGLEKEQWQAGYVQQQSHSVVIARLAIYRDVAPFALALASGAGHSPC